MFKIFSRIQYFWSRYYVIFKPRVYIIVKNIDLMLGYELNVHGIVVLPRGERIYILCTASRKSVVRMQFLIQSKLGILSLGVTRHRANRLRISGAVPQWPKCFCSIGWDQFYSFITWKILSQAVFAFLRPLITQIRKIFYASSTRRNYSHLQIELMIRNMCLYRFPNSVWWLAVRAPLITLVDHRPFQKTNY